MKIFILALTIVFSTSVFSEGYRLSPVDKVEIVEKTNFKITYTLPCKDVDFESFTVASDDSGDMELRVGVVYNCKKGAYKKFERTITPAWNEYNLFQPALESEGVSLVPMTTQKYSR